MFYIRKLGHCQNQKEINNETALEKQEVYLLK